MRDSILPNSTSPLSKPQRLEMVGQMWTVTQSEAEPETLDHFTSPSIPVDTWRRRRRAAGREGGGGTHVIARTVLVSASVGERTRLRAAPSRNPFLFAPVASGPCS